MVHKPATTMTPGAIACTCSRALLLCCSFRRPRTPAALAEEGQVLAAGLDPSELEGKRSAVWRDKEGILPIVRHPGRSLPHDWNGEVPRVFQEPSAMVKEYVGEAKALLEELKPEAGASTGGGLSRAGFLKALAGGLAALAVAAIGVEEASASLMRSRLDYVPMDLAVRAKEPATGGDGVQPMGCPRKDCTLWACGPCGTCGSGRIECVRWCRIWDPCAGYDKWVRERDCFPCP